MAKKIWKRNEGNDRRKKNKSGKDRKHEIIGKPRRHRKCVMIDDIPGCMCEGPLNAVEVHGSNVILSSSWGKSPEDGIQHFKKRWLRSQYSPVCSRDEPIPSRFFSPAANLPPLFRSAIRELTAEECPREEKADRR